MKRIHGPEEKAVKEGSRALRWALAGAVMLSGIGCSGVNTNVPAPTVQAVQQRPGTIDDQSARTVNVHGLNARVLYPSMPLPKMVFESSWYRQSNGIVNNEHGTSYLYEANVLRQVWEGDHTMISHFEFAFVMDPVTRRNCIFAAIFPKELDRTQFADPQERGSRRFEFGSFPESVTRNMNDVIVVVDFTVGLPSSMTAHAIPRDVDGHLLGTTPEGQLAYTITFYPISQRAFGGWSVLR